MIRACFRPALVLAFALGGACAGGVHLEPAPKTAAVAKPKPSTSSSVTAPPSASIDTSGPAPDPEKATRWVWTTIGCQIGAAWSEALGALGDERVLSTLRRCRTVMTEMLGAKMEDDATMLRVRDIDAPTLDKIIAKLEKAGADLAPLVRASAEASREAILARRAAESMRKGASLASVEKALGAREALTKLWGRKEKEAKTLGLILAADRIEATRGLDGAAKIVLAAPAFETVFGVKPASDWNAYLIAVAKSLGSPAEDEKTALSAIIATFADRFEAQGKAVDPGEAKEVSWGYARRLRKELTDAAAAKTKK